MMKNSNKQGVLNRIDELSLTMFTEVQSKIINIRHQNVISDADIAELYGVETKRVNEAVKNNPEKFPDDYMFTLTLEELQDLRSKISSTKVSIKSRTMPKVFIEKGLYMLATILESKRAIEATFAIIETFTKVRYLKQEIVNLHMENDHKSKRTKCNVSAKSLQTSSCLT